MIFGKARCVAGLVLLTLLTIFPSQSKASQIAWHDDMRTAIEMAERTGKPLLVQVTAKWCGYCHKMFDQTYSQSSVAEFVNSNFVCIKVDADRNPQVVQNLSVTSLPTTIIISTQLEVLKKLNGFQSAIAMNQQLGEFQLAAHTERASGAAARASVQQASRTVETAAVTEISEAEIAAARTHFAPVVESSTAAATVKVQMERQFAFGQNCLVSLIAERKKIEGRPEFRVNYRGFDVCFASAEHKQEFEVNPEQYWPMLDGRCAVTLLDDHVHAAGQPEFGAVFRSRMWFFTSPENMRSFIESPREYLDAVQDRMASSN